VSPISFSLNCVHLLRRDIEAAQPAQSDISAL